MARRFLSAERRPGTGALLWRMSDRWLRSRRAPDGPSQLRAAFPLIRSGDPAWRFRTRAPRWLDARFGPIGPVLNARLKLLAAGVPVYSCPRRSIHRLIRAVWWIPVILPGCDCDPDRVLDMLVVRRDGRYLVLGID